MITIDCVSDLHGEYPSDLQGGDLLIVAGDWTSTHTEQECFEFFDWVDAQNYRKKIVIAGNHDEEPFKQSYCGPLNNEFSYLCDSGTEFEGFKIWGSPWTKTFPGMNPHCKAFTVDTEEELAEKWALIPNDIDILITHSPPLGQRDRGKNKNRCGSRSLLLRLLEIRPKLHVFGHIHAGYGQSTYEGIIMVNACHMDDVYDPINKPIRIIL